MTVQVRAYLVKNKHQGPFLPAWWARLLIAFMRTLTMMTNMVDFGNDAAAADAGPCCRARGPHQGGIGVVPGPDRETHARSRTCLGGGRRLETPSCKEYAQAHTLDFHRTSSLRTTHVCRTNVPNIYECVRAESLCPRQGGMFSFFTPFYVPFHLQACMIHDDSSDDLRTKSKRALKAILAKCTHLQVHIQGIRRYVHTPISYFYKRSR